jgi:Glycosidases
VNMNYTQINVERELQNPHSVLNYYKKLIKLRKSCPVIVYGDYSEIETDSDRVFAYTRCLDSQRLLVILNFSESETVLKLPESIDLNGFEEVLCNYGDDSGVQAGAISLRPYEAVVYSDKTI